MSAAYDWATKLVTLGFGTLTAGTGTIGVNAFPDRVDDEIAVFEYPGEPDLVTHGGVSQFEYPAIQVHVRRTDPQEAYSQCYAIYAALRGLKDQTLNGFLYDYIESKQYPFKMPTDERERVTWFCEFLTHRRPA
jgi:hypothetical protein